MHHTTKISSKIIGIFTAYFLIFAPNMASAAMPTAQQIYNFYDAGGPNCWASDAETFCANWGGCSAYNWWEYRASFCFDGYTVDTQRRQFAEESVMRSPSMVVQDLGISDDGIDFSQLEAEQIINTGMSSTYTETEATCAALAELYNYGAYPIIPMNNDDFDYHTYNIPWWNGETVRTQEVAYRLSFDNSDIFNAIQYAHQKTGTQFPTSIETHADWATHYLGIECDYNWDSFYARSESAYNMDCGTFSDLYNDAINISCPYNRDLVGGWITAMYPDNSYGSEILSAMYNAQSLYDAFCETCNESTWGQTGCTKYDIAKAAGVKNVDTCGFDGQGASSTPGCYKLTLNPNGGTAASTSTLYYKGSEMGYSGNTVDAVYTDSACTTRLTDMSKITPTRSGYTFVGYEMSQSYATDITSNGTLISPAIINSADYGYAYGIVLHSVAACDSGYLGDNDFTFYARWAQNPTQPSNGTAQVTKRYSVGVGGPDCVWIDYTVNYSTTCNTGYSAVNGTTLTPSCTANKYTITLDMQGGSVGTTLLTIDATYGQPFAYTYATYPAKSGYTYGGFYTGTNCTGTQYIGVDSPSTYQLSSIRNWDKTSNTTLYACWRKESGNDHNLTCADVFEFYANGGPRCWSTHNDMIICGFEIDVCMEKEMWKYRDAFCADGVEYSENQYSNTYALSSAVRTPLDAASELGLDCSTYQTDDGNSMYELPAQQAIEQQDFGAYSYEDAVCETLSELYHNCADSAIPENDTNDSLWWNYSTCSGQICNWVLSGIGSDVWDAMRYAKQNYASSNRNTQATQAANYLGYNCQFSGLSTCPTPPMPCDYFTDLYGDDLTNFSCPDSTDEIGGWIAEMGPNHAHEIEYAQVATQLYNTYCTKCGGSNTATTGCYAGDIATALGLNAQSCGFATSAAYSLNYSSIAEAMSSAEDGNQNCYGDHGGDGPILVRCDCRTKMADYTGENEFLYEINMPSYAQVNCPTSGVPESAIKGMSCSLSGTYNDYSQGRLLCVSQSVLENASDSCTDICGCGNPWTQTTVPLGDEFFDEYDDVCAQSSHDTNTYYCNRAGSDTSYMSRQIAMTEPEYSNGCLAKENTAFSCAANMYYDNSGNADDGVWCSNCPSYTLADGTSQPGSLTALTYAPSITQCTVPTTSILRGTNGDFRYKNACAYTK